ncbi:MAG: hypothetical protein J3K34DRAFT_17298 [Monoraphidium minutum]|nr:MAG: hypothetical protein J3K34DRAFT_17298 [Monoraphidium minutum]
MEREVNSELEGGPGASSTGAPEPPTLEPVILPAPPPPTIDAAALPAVQQLLEAAPTLAAWDALRLLLSQRAALPHPADEATARAVFAVACHCSEPQMAQDAAAAFLEWCGAGPLAAADCCLLMDSLDIEGTPPPSSCPWLPGAADFLEALHAMGVSKPAPAGGGGGDGGHKAAAAGQEGGQQQEGYRDANLHLLLQLLAALCQLSAAGKLPAGGLRLPEGHGRALAAALLHLHADPRARAAALPQLREATAALVDAFGDTEWGRVLPDLAGRFAAPLGPSHRAALGVLLELPACGGSGRACALQRAGGLQLLRRLVDKAAPQAGGARGGGDDPGLIALYAVHSLGCDDQQIAQLLQRLTPGGGKKGRGGKAGGGAADYWALQSAVEAVDMVLWSFVDRPEGNLLDARISEMFVARLSTLSRLLKSQVSAHHLRARITELQNVYEPDFFNQLPFPNRLDDGLEAASE